MKTRTALAVFAAALLSAQPPAPERPARYPARGLNGAVAAGADFAANAGMRLFQNGGNAIDAGVAAMLAAAVTEFSHFGFGGEAPILVHARGRTAAIAGVGTMPRLATAEFFRNRKLRPGEIYEIERNGLDHMVPTAGLMPALVPGMVDAALAALKEFGTKTFAEVAAPAIELAAGFPIDEPRVMTLYATRDVSAAWPESRAVFLPGGRLPRAGDNFRQPDLARTLREMVQAERGPTREKAIDAVRDFFYRGAIARRIAAFSEAHGGLLRYEDFASFRAEVEDAVCAGYRGATVCKPGFWTQGPAMIETLNLLETFNLAQLRWNSPQYIHAVTEALKLAYADRDTWYGDPKFTPPPLPLLSKEYARSRRALIGERASLSFTPGAIEGREAKHPSLTKTGEVRIDDALMARDTTCVVAMDKDGNVFSATPSGAWLPSVIAGDTGIPLTQRAQSFLLVPGHPNELAGGKRPRVTLSPTLVLREGKPLAALSTPGGDNQDQALLQVLLNLLEFNMNAQQAVEAPRFQTRHLVSSFDNHGMNPGDLLLDERIPQAALDELAARGHKAHRRNRYSSGSAPVLVRLTPAGVIEAGADPYGYRTARAF